MCTGNIASAASLIARSLTACRGGTASRFVRVAFLGSRSTFGRPLNWWVSSQHQWSPYVLTTCGYPNVSGVSTPQTLFAPAALCRLLLL